MILIVDSHALIHRAFHAYPETLTLKDGTVINAVYGFASLLISAIEKLKPDKVICAFDTAAPTFRRAEYADYKAQRAETKDTLIPQFALVEKIVEAFDVGIAKLAGFEADDVIGTLAKKLSKNEEIIILTGDADEYQLLSKDVSIFMAARSFKDSKVFTYSEIKTKLGFKPELLSDYKALKGDSSDNIPGVAGIGEKVATDLVQRFGTIEEIYKNIDKIEPKIQKKLLDQYELAIKFKDLNTIRTDVPLDVDINLLEKSKFNDFDLSKVENLFKEFEFRSLFERVKRLKSNYASDLDKPASINSKEQKIPVSKKNNEISKLENTLFDNITEIEPIEFKNYYIGWDLKDFLKRNYSKYLLYKDKNIQFFDLQLASYLLNNSAPLDYNNAVYKFLETTSIENDSQIKLFDKLILLFNDNQELKKLFFELEMPVLFTLLEMERAGIAIDKEKLEELDKKLEIDMNDLKNEIFKYSGHEFNVDSPKQVGEILALEQGIPLKKKSKSGQYGTSADDLEKFIGTNPIIEKLLEYRALSKLKSTYTVGLISSIQNDGKIHTTYSQAQVATGRISSNSPNLQNIPKGSEYSDAIKSSFIANPKNPNSKLIDFDYSQQEIRLLAYLAKEESLISAFKNSKDIHKVTASKIYNVDYSEVTKVQRNAAKTINFGIIYGMGSRALAASLKISQEEARQIISEFYEGYPAIKKYYENLFSEAKDNGFITTILGRRKDTRILNSNNKGLVSQIEREVMNFPIQGSAADMTKLAMRDVSNYIKSRNLDDKVELLLQVHDELLFETDLTDLELENVCNDIKHIMSNVLPDISNVLPIEVDYKLAKRWG